MSHQRIRTLIVDDSIIYRKVIRDALSQMPNIELVGTASNGRVALDRIKQTKIDLLTLDIEMPELDGLAVLETLRRDHSETTAIVLSGQTQTGATKTMSALELGAFDFVLKPAGNSLDENSQRLLSMLRPRIEAFGQSPRFLRKTVLASSPVSPQPGAITMETTLSTPHIKRTGPLSQVTPEIVVIGVSTGGPATLNEIIPELPADFPAPILIVQHMPPLFTRSLAADLNRQSPLDIQEARHQEQIGPGQIRIAPGGQQMSIHHQFGRTALVISKDPPVKNCRPSVDFLFRDVAKAFGNRALGVILTGMGDDGLDGCRCLRSKNAPVIAQNKETSVVYGMPKAVIEAGLATQIAGNTEIPAMIMNHFQPGARR